MADAGIVLDRDRRHRLGIDEAVLCGDKAPQAIATILDQVAARGDAMLLTRLTPETLALLPAARRDALDYDPLSRTAVFGQVPAPALLGEVVIVAAGTSDLRVCREARRTLAFHGVGASEIVDVGVAGIWRLLDRLPEIQAHRVVIAVAGMDAALISVLGGLIPGVLIAVPTSTGYGAARGGETALGAALASCAPGVSVVNIDNGYGAACAALRVLRAAGLR